MLLNTGKFQTEESFRLLVDSVVDYALLILDPQGRIATWNRGAERIKLYRAEEIVGKHFSIFYPPDAVERGVPEHELTMATVHGRHEDEGWRIRKDGTRFWANVVVTALHDQQGHLVGFGKVTRDLSERRKAEQGLAAAYDQINSVLECTSDAVIKIDRQWKLIYGSRKAAASLPDLSVGKDYWECFPGVRGTSLEGVLLDAMQNQTKATYEIFYQPYQKWYRGNVFPVDDGLSIFFSDITDEKALQEELERSRFLKEKRIEALSHMAGGLAHEINNPLAVIHAKANDLLYASSAGEPLPADEVRKACEAIVRTSDRAIRILRGLKGFGRDADKDPMETASIYEIVDQSLELQGSRFERHKVDLRVDLKPYLPYFECREAQIGQVITNLLNNAFDAVLQDEMNERWVRLSVEQAGDRLHIDVTDSGPGIDEAVKAHLMEAFFSTKSLGLGMGIGLSLSRAIALEHGGTLTFCAGAPNTRFRLSLPLSPDDRTNRNQGSPA